MAVALRRRRFTVDEYHRMGEVGIFTAGERLELIEGEVVTMTPIGPRHAACVDRLTQLWTSRLGRRAIVRVQNPILLAKEDSEPQPDVTLLRPRADFYAGGHPTPSDVLLVVEVADSTLEVDRRVKVPLYGRAGVPESWLVDLDAERVEVYREPTADGYDEVRIARRGDSITPTRLLDVVVTVGDLLG